MTITKSLTNIRSLTTAERTALKKIGIKDTASLLAAAKSGEKALASKAGISSDSVREAVNRADLLQVKGLSASRADLFENAGVNSATELAHRNAAALRKVLEKFSKDHPELNVHLPSPKTIGSLIDKAKSLEVVTPPSTTPIDETQARELAGEALHSHIDKVLFSEDPAGKSFRDAILGWRPKEEWPKVQQQMHADVANFVKNAELSTDESVPGSYWFSGRLFQLYTEVKLDKTGKALNAYVEID
ncbi:MAG TPA: DUF4332 domain-containing protein [Myxococcales bacterium]|jgi:hypothetical protein